jgi:predicted kinase
MNFFNFLSESVISAIKKEQKIFLLVIGGTASGKNYVYEKNFNFELIDVDKIAYDLAGGDLEKTRPMLSRAIALANKELEKSLSEGKSVAQVSTGAGVKGTQNKIKKAQSFGFKTALVLVSTDPKVAQERNQERAKVGAQGLVPDWKVQKTNDEARETFNLLKTSVDYSTVINN